MLKDRKRRLALKSSLKERKVIGIFQLPFVALACINTNTDTQCTETDCLVNFKSPLCHFYHYATEIRDKNESPLGLKPLL